MTKDKLTILYKSVATELTLLLDKLDSIKVKRDSHNDDVQHLPMVTPSALATMRGRDLSRIIAQQRSRLLHTFSTAKIDSIENELEQFQDAYNTDEVIKSFIKTSSNFKSFEESWSPLRNKFPSLYEFVAGLATVFPGTATVEANFSLIKWMKDEFSSALTNFALEGILHAKQYSVYGS